MNRKWLSFSAALLTFSGFAGPNLVFNSGFELGCDGFVFNKFLRPDTNPAMNIDGPFRDGKTFVTGKSSLCIPNRSGERFEFRGREIKLAPGKKYRCSIWMKSSVPLAVSVGVTGTHPQYRWDSCHRNFEPGSDWREYSFSFTTKKKPFEFYNPVLTFVAEKADPSACLWIDDWRISEAGAPAVSPELEISVMPAEPYFIQEETGNRTVPVRLSAVNHSPVRRLFPVKLEMVENQDGNMPVLAPFRIQPLPEKTIVLEPGERKDISLAVPTPRYGAFEIRPTVKGARAMTYGSPFTVSGKYVPAPVDLGRDFCIGINATSCFGRPPEYRFKQEAFLCMKYSPDGMMKFFADHGFRAIRLYSFPEGTLSWFSVEPENGKFDLASYRRTLELAKRNHVQILPVLGDNDFCRNDNLAGEKRKLAVGLPDWLIPLCKKELARGQRDFSKNALFKPPMNYWRRFVHAVVEAGRGQVTHYEIMNEPHLKFAYHPADYVPYLKGAFEEIRRTDPNAKVVGFCATSDLGARMMAFYEPCFQAGGLNYADVVSFHPYQNPKLGSLQPADKTVETIRALIAKFSPKNYPLWNTELYYLRGKHTNNWDNWYCGSSDLSQRLLLDLGEGLGQSISLEFQQIFRKIGPHYLSTDGFAAGGVPNSLAVAANAFARFFEGAKPIDKLRWPNDVICYVYRMRNGKSAAAFWCYGGLQKVKLTLPVSASEAVLRDLHGNREDLAGSIELTEAPKMLFWNGKPEEFTARLRQAKVDSFRTISVAPAVRILPGKNGKSVAAGLKNLSSGKVSGSVGIGGSAVASEAKPFEIEPYGETSVRIPVLRASAGKASVRVVSGGNRFDFPVNIPQETRTCRAGEWQALDRATLGKPSLPAGRWRALSTENGLVLDVEVTDSTSSGESGKRNPWEQDCVELFFDPAPGLMPCRFTERYHSGVRRLFLLPRVREIRSMPVEPKFVSAVKNRFEETSSGYRIQTVIPWSALGRTMPKAGESIGFEIIVDNADGALPAASSAAWSGRDKMFLNRFNFGLILF